MHTHRLQIHAVDLRDIPALEGFCDFLKATLTRLDIIINNACQTVRRPASYYSHLLPAERRMEQALAAGGDVETAALDGTGVPVGEGATGVTVEGLLPLLAQQAMRVGRKPQEGAARRIAPVVDDCHASCAPAAEDRVDVRNASKVLSTLALYQYLCSSSDVCAFLPGGRSGCACVRGEGAGGSGHVARRDVATDSHR